MTVTSTSADAGPFVPDGVTTAFPFTFDAQTADEIAVVRRAASGAETAMTSYSIAFNGDGTGTVNFAGAPAVGDPIYIYSLPDFSQQVDFQNQGSWSPTSMDKALDRAAMRDIFLKDRLSRAILAPVGETMTAFLPTAAQRANQYLSFDGAGNPTAVPVAVGQKGDPGSPGEGYATRTAMASRAAPALLDDVYLTENANRRGKFVVDAAASWTAAIAADTRQAVFVPSTADATKVYVRVREYNYLHIDWFDPNGSGSSDDTAAFVALRKLAEALATNAGSGLKAGPEIRLGHKTYLLSSTFDWKGCSCRWIGTDSGSTGIANNGSCIKMANGASFVVNRADTELGGMGTTISAFGADGSTFEHIAFSGSGGGTVPVVKWRCQAHSIRCRYLSGGSHGLAIDATSGGAAGLQGNANGWSSLCDVFTSNGGSGLAIGTVASADVNGGSCFGSAFFANARYGIEHSGFLGDVFRGILCEANTLGHVHQTDVNAVCVFEGYFEGGVPVSTLAGRSYASGPNSGATFAGSATLFANAGAMTVNALTVSGASILSGIVSAAGDVRVSGGNVIRAYSGTAESGTRTYIVSTAGQGHLTCFNGVAHEPLDINCLSLTVTIVAATVGTWTATGLNLASGTSLKVNSQQVVGARGASLPADATDLATAIALVNAIKARLKTTGGHGLVAD